MPADACGHGGQDAARGELRAAVAGELVRWGADGRSETIQVDVGGATIETQAVRTADSVTIPIKIRLPGGGWVDSIVKMDPQTFDRAVALNRRHGIIPRLSAALSRELGEDIQYRRILPR